MRKIFPFLLWCHWLAALASAATLIPGSELSFSGVSFDYTRVRFSSATGETGASVSLNGDALVVNFGGFGGTALPASFSSDYSSGYLGLRIQAIESMIADLTIQAQGTYALQAPGVDAWAMVSGGIPFSMQVLGINGIPYTGTNLSRSYSLQFNPSAVTLDYPGPARDQNNQDIPAAGIWTAQWSLAGMASTLAGIFQLGTGQQITELDVAVTPDISTAAGGNGAATVTMGQIQFTPTPEPSSLTLVGVAGWALWAFRRRRG